MNSSASIRAAVDADRPALGQLGELLDQPEARLVVMERAGEVAAAGIDPRGTATQPGEPLFALSGKVTIDEARSLLDHLLEALAAPARRLLATCDPLDAEALKRLEALGFRPTGTMPYFELGGGQVEYVSGYRSAAGATLELARSV